MKLVKHPKDAVIPDGLEPADSDDEDDELEEGTGMRYKNRTLEIPRKNSVLKDVKKLV